MLFPESGESNYLHMRDILEADKAKALEHMKYYLQINNWSLRVSTFPDANSRDIRQSTSQAVAHGGTQGMFVIRGRWPSLRGERMVHVGVGEG